MFPIFESFCCQSIEWCQQQIVVFLFVVKLLQRTVAIEYFHLASTTSIVRYNRYNKRTDRLIYSPLGIRRLTVNSTESKQKHVFLFWAICWCVQCSYGLRNSIRRVFVERICWSEWSLSNHCAQYTDMRWCLWNRFFFVRMWRLCSLMSHLVFNLLTHSQRSCTSCPVQRIQ